LGLLADVYMKRGSAAAANILNSSKPNPLLLGTAYDAKLPTKIVLGAG